MSKHESVLADKIASCLLGGAIGDALGFTTENLSRQRIQTKFNRVPSIFIDILSALSYAHEHGSTHGAIDTNNLRVAGGAGSRGIGLISNFGLAERLFRDLEWDGPSTETRTSGLYGDPDGICPEFCHAQRQSPLSDQYQIGCALYQTLCGRPPFERPATTQVLLAHMKDEPDDIRAKNSEIPAELIGVVLRCLRKDPAERYPSAKALASELKQFVNQ